MKWRNWLGIALYMSLYSQLTKFSRHQYNCRNLFANCDWHLSPVAVCLMTSSSKGRGKRLIKGFYIPLLYINFFAFPFFIRGKRNLNNVEINSFFQLLNSFSIMIEFPFEQSNGNQKMCIRMLQLCKLSKIFWVEFSSLNGMWTAYEKTIRRNKCGIYRWLLVSTRAVQFSTSVNALLKRMK